MAKLTDKFFNRVIEGPLVLEEAEKEQVTQAVEADSSLKIFENIVDKDGHKRFVKGEVSLLNTAPEGMTKKYAVWSLSGSHLLIVLSCDIADTTVVNDGVALAKLDNLPSWIYDKIIPIVQDTLIEYKPIYAYAQNYSNQAFNLRLNKRVDGIVIYKEGAITMSANRVFRVIFDLQID